jgi:putative MATE family efflux protein
VKNHLSLKDNQIRKTILVLILPIILENIFQVSANIVSTAMVGRLSPVDISAQGICFSISGVILVLVKGLSIGAALYISRAYGEKNYDKARDLFISGLGATLLVMLILIGIILGYSHGFFTFMTDDTSVIIIALSYIKILVIGMPFVAIISFVTAVHQGFGDTKTPMSVAIFMNVVNIVLGYLLIFGFGPIQGLGIYGAGIALVSAQILSALLGLYLVFRQNGLFKECSKKSKGQVVMGHVKDIYTMGIPVSIESIFWQLSAIVMSKIILSYGQSYFAAYQLGIQAETLTELPAIGFGVAAVTLTSRAIGEKNQRLFRAYIHELVKLSAAISVVTSLLLILLPKFFMSLFTNHTSLQDIGVLYIFVMGFIQIPQNLSRIFNGVIRSCGYKNTPMFIAGAGIWLFRIPLALVIAYWLKWDILFIWLCIAIDQLVRFILSVGFFKFKRIDAYLDQAGQLDEMNV